MAPDAATDADPLKGTLFALGEVAELLGVSLEQVELWTKCGPLAAMGPAEDQRVMRQELDPLVRPLLSRDQYDAFGLSDPHLQQALTSNSVFKSQYALWRERRDELRHRPLFHYTTATAALEGILLYGSLRLNPPTQRLSGK